jgi:ADP-ribose pyrophosphatase YjhB (NUDIX family)
MWKKIISAIWRRVPRWARRWGVLLSQARFTVTTGAVIVDEQERVLLCQHCFRPGESWGIPGGFIQAGEQPAAAIRRELREEIGVEIAEQELLLVRTLTVWRQVEILYRCRIRGHAQPCALEISRVEWFAFEQLPASLSNDQRRLIARVLQEQRHEKMVV